MGTPKHQEQRETQEKTGLDLKFLRSPNFKDNPSSVLQIVGPACFLLSLLLLGETSCMIDSKRKRTINPSQKQRPPSK